MNITLPNGDVKELEKGTTGFEIALSISPRLAKDALGIFVNGKQYDLSRPINEDAEVKIVTFNDPEGKQIFWHSSAHLMAEAVEALYPGTKFGVGPAIENGFYYDVDIPGDVKLSVEDLPKIEKKMKELVQNKEEYKRIEIPWEKALAHFEKEGDQYKVELLEDLKDDEITFYQQGGFVDLCRGTHVPNTGVLKHFKLLNVAGAYWRGDADRNMMTRIYGVSFPKKKMLDEFLEMLEEAKKRDHRKLGRELELYFITPDIGVGLVNWLPKGTTARRLIEDFIKREHARRGYSEVITPHIGNLNMYKTSGHYPYYKESQFPPVELENEQFLLKPMNCPHHHIMYAQKPKSYRDLPIRYFELGTVYRYEKSGELNGLSRARGFTQDDAHIYCTLDQIKQEVIGVVDLIQFLFKTFNMELKARLSFRDADNTKFSGDPELWDRAQKDLVEAADAINLDYEIVEGEAAFYGPKIDFDIKDALGRNWQLGTVQVDYIMPERFQLEYIGSDNAAHRPVIIHRAPLGSFERFFSILVEHYAGNFPFWMAPVQAAVLPIGENQHDYARSLHKKFAAEGFRIETDYRSEKINRKIAEAEQMKTPFSMVVGQKEADAGTISIRRHGRGDLGSKSVSEVIEMFKRIDVPGADEEE